MTTHSFRIVFILGLALSCTVLGLAPPPAQAPAAAMPAMALTIFTVAMLATGAVPEFIAAIIFFTVAAVIAVAPPEAIFSGFHSNALWLVFSGLVIGAAAERTGLGKWIAQAFIKRIGNSYGRMIAAIILGATAMSFVIPSSIGRFSIMVPVVAAIAKESGYPAGSNRYIGAILAAVFGGFFISLGVLPANLINIVMVGAAETMHDLNITYGEYLLMNMPVLGVVKGVLIGALVLLIFRPKAPPETPRVSPPAPLSDEGRKLGMILIFALVVWATDSVHGVAPGWVALTAAAICLLPGIQLVPPQVFAEKVNFVTVLYIASVLGIGAVLSHSGAGELLSRLIVGVSRVEGQSPAYGYFAVSALSTLLPTVATLPGSIAILTPVAGDIAAATGLDVKIAAMAQLNGMSSVLFPYQAPPLLVGLTFGGVTVAQSLKLLLPLSIITILVLVPMNFIWWRWLGYIQ
ncbi:MAG: SLC13 family permease [Magnetovibrio sp.]|nr:SLC13 family permease [Magnetovibrio sp.]